MDHRVSRDGANHFVKPLGRTERDVNEQAFATRHLTRTTTDAAQVFLADLIAQGLRE